MSNDLVNIETARVRLQNRLSELGHEAKKALGQNFLVSDTVIKSIIEALRSFDPKQVVEIGPGCGALTDILKLYYPDMTLIELDRKLATYWREQNLKVIEADALRIDWKVFKDHTLISNLPYQISSSIVIDRSIDDDGLNGMVLMFQKEVAQRIRADEKSEHYGMLSVIASEFWKIETVCDAGPRDFSPAPKVASRVLKFVRKSTDITDRKNYLEFIKKCFKQRRRILKSNLDKNQAEQFLFWCAESKKSDKVRAEELSPIELKALYYHLGIKK